MSADSGGVLTTIATCAGAGAFIDFYIGKDGQKRVKDRLDSWRRRLLEIKIEEVGRAEAQNALRVIDYLFGPKLFSWKRLKSAIIFKLVSLCIYPGLYIAAAAVGLVRIDFEIDESSLLTIIFDLFFLALSISISRFIVTIAIRLVGQSIVRNLLLIICSILLQFIVLIYLNGLITATVGFLPAAVGIVLDSFDESSSVIRDIPHVLALVARGTMF
jgi:hypothetical protein